MFPREFIESFLKDYSPEEKIKIKKDLEGVKKLTFDEAKSISPPGAPIYLATAGGPGSGKSTVLETFIKENKLEHFVYADPDQVSLKNMNFTYRKSLSNYHFAEAKSNYDALKDAYNKWRAASNYICHEILQTAFGSENNQSQQFSIAHGTTSTNPVIVQLYQKIKSLNYRINLLLCYSPDETRKQAIEKRENEQAFVQVDPKDIISKGQEFPKRFDIYLQCADEITFYWNEKLEHGRLPKPCANLVKTSNGLPVLTVNDPRAWESFSKKYLDDCKKYGIEISKTFESLIPKKLLLKIREQSSHLAHSLYAISIKPIAGSVESIEHHEAIVVSKSSFS